MTSFKKKRVTFAVEEDDVQYYDSYVTYAVEMEDIHAVQYLKQIWYTGIEYAEMNFDRLDTIERMCILDGYVYDDDDEYCTLGLEIPKESTKRLLDASYSIEAVIDELEFQWDHDITDPESIRLFYRDWTKSSLQLAQDRARKLHQDLVRIDDEVRQAVDKNVDIQTFPSPNNSKVKKNLKNLILQDKQEYIEEDFFDDVIDFCWNSDQTDDESQDEEALQEGDEDGNGQDDKDDILSDMLEVSSSSFDEDSGSTNNDDFDNEVYDDYHTSHYHQMNHDQHQHYQEKCNAFSSSAPLSLVATLSYQEKHNQQTAGGRRRISSSSLSLRELRKLQIEQGSKVLGVAGGSSYNCLEELPSRTLRLLNILDEAINLGSTTPLTTAKGTTSI